MEIGQERRKRSDWGPAGQAMHHRHGKGRVKLAWSVSFPARNIEFVSQTGGSVNVNRYLELFTDGPQWIPVRITDVFESRHGAAWLGKHYDTAVAFAHSAFDLSD